MKYIKLFNENWFTEKLKKIKPADLSKTTETENCELAKDILSKIKEQKDSISKIRFYGSKWGGKTFIFKFNNDEIKIDRRGGYKAKSYSYSIYVNDHEICSNETISKDMFNIIRSLKIKKDLEERNKPRGGQLNESLTTYPTIEEVENADHEKICTWYRFLPSPEMNQEEEIMKLICKKFKEFGGFTPEISKRVGWRH